MNEVLEHVEQNIHEALATGSSNTLQALVDYFSTPARPVTSLELAELWCAMDHFEQYAWVMFSLQLLTDKDKGRARA